MRSLNGSCAVKAADLAPLFGALTEHARRCWPEECCGLLLEDGRGAIQFEPIVNVAGSRAAQGTSTRTVRDGYVMDPKALLAALEKVDKEGGRLAAIVHSHPEVGAYFSREDREMALGGGTEPLWPDVQYLVISVRNGRVDEARLFSWDAPRADFLEEQVSGIAANI